MQPLKYAFSIFALATSLLFVTSTTQAAPLGLNLYPTPDITSNIMDTNYDATSDLLTITGQWGMTVSFDGITHENVAGGTSGFGLYSLTASISDGGVFNSGTISILGTVGAYNSGTLLTGDLTALGFENNGNQLLEFTFDVTGGDLAPLFSGAPYGGTIINTSGYNDDNFNSNFSASFSAGADTAPAPVPAAVWMFGSALLGLAGVKARRKA